MWKLKKDSISAKFYAWVWNEKVTDYKTMCPYTWKYLFTIVLLPVILIGKLLFHITPKKKEIGKGLDYVADSKVGVATGNVLEKIADQHLLWRIVGNTIKWGAIIFTCLMVLTAVAAIGFMIWTSPIGFLAVVGGITLFAVAVFFFFDFNIGGKIIRLFKIFGSMVYSLYKKACPRIEWV